LVFVALASNFKNRNLNKASQYPNSGIFWAFLGDFSKINLQEMNYGRKK